MRFLGGSNQTVVVIFHTFSVSHLTIRWRIQHCYLVESGGVRRAAVGAGWHLDYRFGWSH